MGLLDGLRGNATEVNADKSQTELAPILLDDEVIERAFKVLRDSYVFTNKRLILVDKQALTGSKVEYFSLPYKSITRFSVETAGSFDLDSELKIWVSGSHDPIKKQFKKGTDILGIQKILASRILG
jgi:Bacterial PH domain